LPKYPNRFYIRGFFGNALAFCEAALSVFIKSLGPKFRNCCKCNFSAERLKRGVDEVKAGL